MALSTLLALAGYVLGGFPSSHDSVLPEHDRSGPHASGWSTFWWNDYDSDGLVDALVLQPGGQGRLLRNRGQGAFEDVTETSGMAGTSGVHMALWKDFDGDGRSDVFLASWRGASRLMRQARAGVFTDVTEEAGLSARLDPIDAEWVDYDGDQLFDLRVTTLERDWLFQNRGGVFGRVDLGLDAGVSLIAAGIEMPATVDEARRLRGLGTITPGESVEASASTNAPGAGSSTPPGGTTAEGGSGCARSIEDEAFPGVCLPASSIPTLGSLFPISTEFFIDASNGRVGVGTTNPGAKLDVAGGNVRTSGKFISTATSGAPLTVASDVLVANLNADKLDGLDAGAFSQLGNTIETAEIAAGAVTNGKLAGSAVTSAKIADGSVASADLADNAVNGAKIQDDAVGSSELASNSVNAAEIAAGAVGSSEIADGSITNADVSNSAAISGTKIVPNFGTQDVVTFGLGQFNGDLNVTGEMNAYHPLAGGRAVQGWASNTSSSTSYGGIFFNDSPIGYGVYSHARGTTGASVGVYGRSEGNGGNGIYGHATHTNSYTAGVTGWGTGWGGRGVFGANYGTTDSSSAVGVWGRTGSTASYGVWGEAVTASGVNVGVGGYTASANGYGMYSHGKFGATGTKSFIQPHPTDPSKEIRFVCLEGNESGTYFRGSAELLGGLAVIEVPEEFRLASEPTSITVQLTARGPGADLFVESESLDQIVVRGRGDVRFDYLVNGVRRGYADFEPIAENHGYVPRERGVPFGTQYPPTIRQLLIDNDTLNPDLTPNEATAARLGWQLLEPARESMPPSAQPASPSTIDD